MGLIYLDSQMLEEDEEDDQLGSSRDSQPEVKFDKKGEKHPFILDVKLPFWNNSRIPYYIRFLYASKQLIYDTDLVEHGIAEPNALSFLHRSTSLVHIPVVLSSSELFFECLSHSRRIRTTNDLVEPFVSGSGNILVSSSSNFGFNSEERSVLKSSLFSQLGTLDGVSRPFRARSFSFSPAKGSTFTSSSFGVPSPLSQVPNSDVTSPSNQKPSLNFPEKSLFASSSTSSAGSYQPNSSPCLTVSKGLLHCIWKNGSLNIAFTEGDDLRKVYMANSHKIESSIKKPLDYIYTFCSKMVNKAEEFVGKMKVFSSLILHSDQSKLMETEFVLCGVEDHSKDVQNLRSKNKSLSRMMSNIFRSNHSSSKLKTTLKINNFQAKDFLDNSLLSKSSDFGELENGFIPNLELAAIVVRSSTHWGEKEAKTGGWGLKFLEKVTRDCVDSSIEHNISESCEGNHVKNIRNSLRGMDVLIPAGFHGGAIQSDGGLSTLIERWRSGGRCDCGGWDIGCPLTVLHDDRNSFVQKDITEDDSEGNCKSMDLFLEGAKDGEPALKIINTSEGMYTMLFQPTLSALQAFSVGVAFIHSQTPSLYPNL